MPAAPAAFIYHPSLPTLALKEGHVLQPSRLQYAYKLLEAYGAFRCPDSQLRAPAPATEAELLSFHTPEYVRAVRAFSRSDLSLGPERFNFSDEGDNPVTPGMYEAGCLAVGGSLLAARLVAEGACRAAFNVAGGLHHAQPGYASGFCVFNDAVIAIRSLLARGLRGRGSDAGASAARSLLARGLRVAYVDIDAHHGDGVNDAFYATDQVLTISLHESGQYLFPGTGEAKETGRGPGEGYAVNLPLAPFTGDDVYRWAFRAVAMPLVEAYKPDILVTQLGVDGHYRDPLTHLSLTTAGYLRLFQELAALQLPWVALGGGGYEVEAVARCWAIAYGALLDVVWPDLIPPVYRERYGLVRLYDPPGEPPLDSGQQAQARAFAEASVRTIRERGFPRHGLRAGA